MVTSPYLLVYFSYDIFHLFHVLELCGCLVVFLVAGRANLVGAGKTLNDSSSRGTLKLLPERLNTQV